MNKNSKCPLDCAVKGCGTELCRRYKDYKQGEKEGIRKFAEWLTHNFVYTHGIGFSRLSFSRKYTIDEVIAEYEKESGNERKES